MENKNKRKWVELLWITELFQRYYGNRATEKEKRVVENWDPEKDHKSDLSFLPSDEETERLWQKVATEMNLKTYSKRKQRFPIYRYAAVASVLLLISITYWVINQPFKPGENTPVAMGTKGKIQTGTDKATLTLEDGSEIPLEIGATYKTHNAQSNGTQIVYKTPSSDIAVKTPEVTYNYLTVPRGGQFYVQLSDGTKIWLNSESKLKYPVRFTDSTTRQVELLYGEAYFDVSPSTLHQGAKFKVIAPFQEVEVLGTEFNIKAYKGEPNIYTTLVEGKVAVSTENAKEKLLPNQQSVINAGNNNIMIKGVDVYNASSWRKGIFSFKDMTLKEITTVLSRWYDVDVEFENDSLKNVEFNGVLKKEQSLDEILTAIQTTKFINAYEIKDKNIILK